MEGSEYIMEEVTCQGGSGGIKDTTDEGLSNLS
jgi:hypothetical protein